MTETMYSLTQEVGWAEGGGQEEPTNILNSRQVALMDQLWARGLGQADDNI